MRANAHDALEGALELLGFGNEKPFYYRAKLLKAIGDDADRTRDLDLSRACAERLSLLQSRERPLPRD